MSMVILKLTLILINQWTFTLSNQRIMNSAIVHITENEITGTGNFLKDIAYQSSCLNLNCTYCCEGEINNITCASRVVCKKYKIEIINKRKPKLIVIIISICIIYLVIPLCRLIIFFIDKKSNKKIYDTLSKIFVVYTGIFLPPFGIFYLLQKKWPDLENMNYLENLFSAEIIKKEKLFNEHKFIGNGYGNPINLPLQNENSINDFNYDNEIHLDSNYFSREEMIINIDHVLRSNNDK